jgi:hypothetical protein
MFAQGLGDCFSFAVDLELLVDVLEVEGDGVDRNVHLARRGLFVMAFDEELEQFGLLRGQMIVGVFGRAIVTEQALWRDQFS